MNFIKPKSSMILLIMESVISCDFSYLYSTHDTKLMIFFGFGFLLIFNCNLQFTYLVIAELCQLHQNPMELVVVFELTILHLKSSK